MILRKSERQQTIDDTCASYRRMIAAGRDKREALDDLADAEGIGWRAIDMRLRRGGALPPYRENSGIKRVRRVGHEAIIDHMDNQPRVHRDPCPRCGCRGDIDCGHHAAALSVWL